MRSSRNEQQSCTASGISAAANVTRSSERAGNGALRSSSGAPTAESASQAKLPPSWPATTVSPRGRVAGSGRAGALGPAMTAKSDISLVSQRLKTAQREYEIHYGKTNRKARPGRGELRQRICGPRAPRCGRSRYESAPRSEDSPNDVRPAAQSGCGGGSAERQSAEDLRAQELPPRRLFCRAAYEIHNGTWG